MINKIAPLISSYAIVLLIAFSGCCDSKDTYCVNVNNTALNAYNNVDSLAVIADNNPVPANAFFLELTLGNQKKVCYEKNRFDLFTAAYARSCPHDVYHYLDSVVNISLYANLDYNKDYPAGAELNTLFSMPDISELNSEQEANAFRLYPTVYPTDTGSYTFTVKLLFADSSIIQTGTSPIILTK